MVQDLTVQLDEHYQNARHSLLLLQLPDPAILHITGPDAVDLLNRMSTNDLSTLAMQSPITTVFTNANARIIDVATVIPGVDELLLLCWQKTSSILKDWLSGYIFFRDDVQLMRSPSQWELLDMIGPEAGSTLLRLTGLKDIPENQAVTIEGGFAWHEPLGPLPRFRLLLKDALIQKYSTGEHDHPPVVRDRALAEILRIEAGLPDLGSEIASETIPLEVGLWDHISFNKGCYIGQEIIARMESRGKLARTLIGLRAEGELSPGLTIFAADRAIGKVTSSTLSPYNGWIGLASVKPGSWDPQEELTAGENTRVRIQSLPFP